MTRGDLRARLIAARDSRDVSCNSGKSIAEGEFHLLGQKAWIVGSGWFFSSFFEV